MRIGSLFSGYGGLDLAAQQYFGGGLAWYSEIEPAACQILAAHHPITPNLGDITLVDWAEVEPVDVLTGGYPCQPFSHAGKRKGSSDERHLWPFVATAVNALRPSVVVLENVRGHLSLGFGDVLADLHRMGYDARWGVVRASDAGAPHGRARIFIVAYPHCLGLKTVGAALEAGLGYDTDAITRSSILADDTDIVGYERSGAARHGRAGSAYSDEPSPDTSRGGSGAFGPQRPSETRAAARLNGDSEPPPDTCGQRYGGGENYGVVGRMDQETAESGQRHGPSNRARSEFGTGDDPVAWGKYGAAINRWERVLGRAAPNPTIVGINDRPRLNPIFVEWMMGLDLGHVTGHGLRPAQELKALGNGVCPQQAHLALTMILGEAS